MNIIKSSLYIVTALSLLALGACSNKVTTELSIEISKKGGLLYFAKNPNDSLLLSVVKIADSLAVLDKQDYFDVFVEVWHQKFVDEEMHNHFEKAWKLEYEKNGNNSIAKKTEGQILKDGFEDLQKQSLDVISKRLSEAGAKNVTVKNSEKEDLFKITMTNAPEKEMIKRLVTTHGVFGIYETFDLTSTFEYFDTADKMLLKANEVEASDSGLYVGPIFEILAPSVQEGTEQSWQIAPGPIAGQCFNSDTAKLISLLNAASNVFPREIVFMWSAVASNSDKDMSDLFMIKLYKENSVIDNSHIANVGVSSKQENGSCNIEIEMNDEGKKLLRNLTWQNKGLFLAVVVDSKVFAATIVNERNESGKFNFPVKMNSNQAAELGYILLGGQLLPNVQVLSIK